MTPQENQSSETRVAQPPAVAEGEANGDAALRKGRPPRRANVPHLRRRAEIFLRLREVCKNYSTSELAELTNSHYETVRRHLADKTPPSSSFLSALCDVLGVSAEWLLCGRGEAYRQGQLAIPSAAVQDKVDAVSNATTDIERHLAKLADDVQ